MLFGYLLFVSALHFLSFEAMCPSPCICYLGAVLSCATVFEGAVSFTFDAVEALAITVTPAPPVLVDYDVIPLVEF